ncbi:hypothetical protein HAX54_006432 [Datura stramonium]|uniref:Uncharacterized protein n=1 Tax=Datura stramonium TaxID=4076 RepID=A0ABS8TBP8_DATST|nr:hypothetical protein [Datura stramonium]
MTLFHIAWVAWSELSVLDLRKEQFHRESSTIISWNSATPAGPYIKVEQFLGPISTRQKFWFSSLRILISHNEFSGSLPASFRNFKAMIKSDGTNKGYIGYMSTFLNGPYQGMYEDSVSLVIKGNNIELERISTIMTTIDLSSNHFEGVIPKAITDGFAFGCSIYPTNNLSADIPMEMGQMKICDIRSLLESAHWKDSAGIDKANISGNVKPLSKSSCWTDSSRSTIQHIGSIRMVATLTYVVLLYPSSVERVFLSHWSPKKKASHALC